MRIRDTRSAEFVVSYVGRRDDGRSWTPAVCTHRSASLQGGAPALQNPFQQASVQPAAIAGHPLSDALPRLDLSRGRGAVGRAPRVARGAGTDEGARFHDSVSLPATLGRPD